MRAIPATALAMSNAGKLAKDLNQTYAQVGALIAAFDAENPSAAQALHTACNQENFAAAIRSSTYFPAFVRAGFIDSNGRISSPMRCAVLEFWPRIQHEAVARMSRDDERPLDWSLTG